MAWLQKRGGVWWIGWRKDGAQFRKSLGTGEKSLADEALKKMELAEAAHKVNALTADFVSALTSKPVQQSPTLSKYLQDWLTAAEHSTERGTLLKYRQLVREFSAIVGANEPGKLLSDISV